MSPKNHKIYGTITLFVALSIFYMIAYFNGVQRVSILPKVYSQEPMDRKISMAPQIPTPEQFSQRNYFVVMSWNVENLFDTEKDPKTNDIEFTPQGSQQWDKKDFQSKIYNLSDVIRRVDDGFGPDIIGLCEVENKFVLEELCRHPNIQSLGYKYIYHRNGHDGRGIDVAMISRFEAEEISWHYAGASSREILQAKFHIRGEDLYVFVNHWRSRLGGKKQSEYHRIEAAKTCRHLIENIVKKNPVANIIIMGDFNDNPEDDSLKTYLGACISKKKQKSCLLFNLTYTTSPPSWVNTPNYFFDQIIISKNLLNHSKIHYIHDSFETIAYRFMCTKDGWPLSFSTNSHIGYSDHFPVIAIFNLPPKKVN